MLDDLKELFNITDYSEIKFRQIHGLVFVFKTRIIVMKDNAYSGETKPFAIIYKENDDYYLAPLDDRVDIDEIVEEFVKKCLLR